MSPWRSFLLKINSILVTPILFCIIQLEGDTFISTKAHPIQNSRATESRGWLNEFVVWMKKARSTFPIMRIYRTDDVWTETWRG